MSIKSVTQDDLYCQDDYGYNYILEKSIYKNIYIDEICNNIPEEIRNYRIWLFREYNWNRNHYINNLKKLAANPRNYKTFSEIANKYNPYQLIHPFYIVTNDGNIIEAIKCNEFTNWQSILNINISAKQTKQNTFDLKNSSILYKISDTYEGKEIIIDGIRFNLYNMGNIEGTPRYSLLFRNQKKLVGTYPKKLLDLLNLNINNKKDRYFIEVFCWNCLAMFKIEQLMFNLNYPAKIVIKYSRRSNDYNVIKRYGQLVAYKKFIQLFNLIESEGLIINTKGFNDHNNKSNSFLSYFSITNKMRELILQSIDNSEESTSKEIIIMKDSNKKLIDYKDTSETIEYRNIINDWFKIWDDHTFTINEQDYQFHINNPYYKKYSNKIDLKPYLKDAHLSFNNNSFKHGGRFYCSLQDHGKESRLFYKIDNKPICILDYSCLHPRMLYHLEGINPPIDCYQIEGIDRDLLKKAFMIIINSENEKAAINYFQFNINKKLLSLNSLRPIDLINIIKEYHSPISKYFNSNIGIHLQNLDKSLILQIINIFNNQQIPCFPIHDSIITLNNYKQFLYTTMSSVYFNEFRYYPLIHS